jgi:16S rRNA (uracil1498-N3)-methyltransferase
LALLRQAAALVYVDDLEHPVLDDADSHHLAAVLRLRSGEVVAVSDGAGRYRFCRVASGVPGSAPGSSPASPSASASMSASGSGSGSSSGSSGRRRGGAAGRDAIALEPETAIEFVARVEPVVGVGFSLAKGERIEWAVAKLSELGVDRIVPLICERTVVRDVQGVDSRRTDRLRRIARESAIQARRLWLPEVAEPVRFAEVAAALADSCVPAALAEPGGAPVTLATPFVFVGPEGGWAPSELSVGLPTVGLGPTILRIETAAVVAGALLAAVRAGTVAERG